MDWGSHISGEIDDNAIHIFFINVSAVGNMGGYSVYSMS